MRRMVLGLVALAFAGLGGAALFLAMQEPEGPVSPAQVQMGEVEIGGPFELTDHTGARVTSAELIDGPALIYFGYTWCPDICPVDVANMAQAVDILAERGIEVRPIFITVDPARDDPESLSYYVQGMHPEMVGLTGSEAEIEAVAEKFRVYYRKAEMEDSAAGYLMDHTTLTYLVTPEGVRGVFRNGHPPAEIADAVATLLSRG